MIKTRLSAQYAAIAGATVADCPAALSAIHHPEIALAVWQRRLPDGVVAELADLVPGAVDDVQFTAEIDALELALKAQMRKAGYPQTPAFSADIAMLARQHATIVREGRVSVRLEVVESDACRSSMPTT